MPVDTKHPEYKKREAGYKMVRDVVEGEDALRRSGNIETYLPKPPGMIKQQNTARVTASIEQKRSLMIADRYAMYVMFAEMDEMLGEVVNGLQGLIHENGPAVVLPEKLAYLKERATPTGKTLDKLWESVTREIIMLGRTELLGEVVDEGKDELGLCQYVAESLINWQKESRGERARPTLVIFRECDLQAKEKDPYDYDEVQVIRELKLIDAPQDDIGVGTSEATGTYAVRTWKKVKEKGKFVVDSAQDGADADGWVSPQLFGKSFDHIPVTVINATDIGFDFGPAPALPLARVEVSIFRKNADYNRAIYNKGDPQAWVTGATEDDIPGAIGGSTIWCFPNPETQVGYLEITGKGLAEMRMAIEEKRKRFGQLLAAILSDDGGGNRSGETVRREQSPKKATLRSIIVNAASGFEAALRDLGRLSGMSEEECNKITFKPYLDFAEPQLSADEALKWVQFIMSGGTMSKRTLHKMLKRGRATDMEYDDEMDEMGQDGPPIRVGDPGVYVDDDTGNIESIPEDDSATPAEPAPDPAKPAPAKPSKKKAAGKKKKNAAATSPTE